MMQNLIKGVLYVSLENFIHKKFPTLSCTSHALVIFPLYSLSCNILFACFKVEGDSATAHTL